MCALDEAELLAALMLPPSGGAAAAGALAVDVRNEFWDTMQQRGSARRRPGACNGAAAACSLYCTVVPSKHSRAVPAHTAARSAGNTNTNTKYTCDTGQTRNKLLAQWGHLTNHAAGHSRPGTAHLTA
jgi:hypothetical protein